MNDAKFLLGENIKRYLLNAIPSAKLASGGKLITCRCFECGDSKKDSRHTHMYIGMPTATNHGWYYCHLCNCSGILSYRKLLDWGIYDVDLANDLFLHGVTVGNSTKYRNLGTGKIYNVINDMIKNDERSLAKMIYVNNRLGTKLTPVDFMNLKLVVNLNDIIERNNIQSLTRSFNEVQDLDRAFVGFLSMDNGFVTLRKLDDQLVYKSVDSRYVNYRLFDKEDTSERFYVVPQVIDLLQPNRIKLHVAEGGFDILSIYLNVRKQEPGIYATSSGSNYSSVISYFMMEKMIPNLEVHLYPDNDQPQWKINNIVQKYHPFQIPMYIHRNISPKEKDFGVSPDRIKETIVKANNWV